MYLIFHVDPKWQDNDAFYLSVIIQQNNITIQFWMTIGITRMIYFLKVGNRRVYIATAGEGQKYKYTILLHINNGNILWARYETTDVDLDLGNTISWMDQRAS